MNPASRYMVENIIVDGVSKGLRSSYTFTNVTSDHTIHVTFKESDYIFFPYVVQGLRESDGWSSEIAVSFRESGDDAYCILTLKDRAGQMAVLKRTGMDNPVIWSFVLDDMISNFSGSLVPGACSLKVESNYRIDGFSSLNAAGNSGAGAEARYYRGKVKEGAGSLFFPYVLQGLLDTTGFSTGISISSLEDEMPADAYCKLTLTDSAGNVSIYERTSMGTGLVWSFVLDDQMSNFAGTLLPGPCQLKVETNFAIDGFLFINDGSYAYGSLATIPESDYIFFPYVLQGVRESDGWASGIAVSFRESGDDAYCILTLKDRAGQMAVLKRTGMDNPVIWSFVLDDMISNFSGSLVPGACSLKVESNYRIDGFSSFNIAGTFGAGAEARYYSGKVKEGAGSLFFPYVLQGVEDTTGFTTGIAISSLEDEIPADAYCKLTLTDSAGNVSIYERTSMGKGLVWTFVLDSQMSNFAGTLLPGPCQLKVESNFAIDGFLFINVAGTLGYGSLATIQEGVTGDINADDKIGLEEAIHALKVVSGVSVSK